MKILIYGQKSFGLAVLKRIISDGHDIIGAIVAPQETKKDKMFGFATLNNIKVYGDMDRVRSDDIKGDYDLVVSAHSHWIVSSRVLERARFGGIGFHPSILPLHRGQDAVRWTIHMGDKISGGSIYRLDDKCDGGDVLLRRFILVKREWNYHDLWKNLFPMGVEMVSEAIRKIENGTATWERQDESLATWEPSWDRPRMKRNDLIMIE